MKTNEQIKNWILENCVDDCGDIDISGLDFTGFKGSIYRGKWKVDNDLFQGQNEIGGDLYDNNNNIKGDLYKGYNKVKGNSHDNYNEIKCDLYQYANTVKGKTHKEFKWHNKVMKWDRAKGWVEDERFVRQLEDMTKEELIKKIREMEK